MSSERRQPPPIPGSLAVAATVAWVNLRRLSRDRTSLFFILVLPIVVTALIGVAIPGGQGDEPAPEPLGVVTVTGADGLVEALDEHPQLTVERYGDRAGLERAVRRGTVAAGVVVTEGVVAALAEPGDAGDTAVAFLAPPGAEPPVALRQTVATVLAGYEPGAENGPGTASSRGIAIAERVAGTGTDVGIPGGFDHTAPSNLVLFVFINTLVSAGLFADSRQLGVLHRASGAPLGRTALLAGEGATRLLVALGQAALILVLGTLAFGVAWGAPLAVAAIVGLFALVATGAALLLGVAVRRDATITALAPPIGIALGMLGGTMWPLEIVGDGMRAVGHLTPHAWAMDAFTATIGADATITDLATELVVLSGFAAGLMAAAAIVLARRSLAPAA